MTGLSAESAKVVIKEAHELLLGGTVVDVGIRTDNLQPFIALLSIEKDGRRHIVMFDQPPKVDGRY